MQATKLFYDYLVIFFNVREHRFATERLLGNDVSKFFVVREYCVEPICCHAQCFYLISNLGTVVYGSRKYLRSFIYRAAAAFTMCSLLCSVCTELNFAAFKLRYTSCKDIT